MKKAFQALSQSEGMLAKFRRQFIAINMIFAGVVLVVVLVVVSSIMFSQHQKDVYDALDQRISLARSRNNVPGFAGLPLGDLQGHAFDNRKPIESENPNDTPRESASDQFVATSLFVLNEEGDLIAAYDEAFPIDSIVLSRAIALAKEDLIDTSEDGGAGVARGSISSQNLYYQIEPYQHGHLIAFASGNYIDRNMYGLLGPLVGSETAAIFVFLLVSILLARWVTRPVEKAWDKQQQFIADASHELKTPLTVIRANDSILLSQPQATVGDQSQWIESTETEAQVMQDLVNDMLYLAKADNAQIALELNTVNLSDIISGQLLQFESVAFERGLQAAGSIAEDVELLGDAPRLQRLVGTLLDNACKYAEKNSQVDVVLKRQGSKCEFSVHNIGTPISPEDLPHLFDRFYRADKARTRAEGSYGLGLAIAKSIVEEHKGSIYATSSEEAGTTFVVELPVAK